MEKTIRCSIEEFRLAYRVVFGAETNCGCVFGRAAVYYNTQESVAVFENCENFARGRDVYRILIGNTHPCRWVPPHMRSCSTCARNGTCERWPSCEEWVPRNCGHHGAECTTKCIQLL